jgi:hypothetical protein
MKTARNALTGLMISMSASFALANIEQPAAPAVEATEPPAVACISADMNGDLVVNSVDWFLFLAAWSMGKEAADINGSGTVDSQDFFDYIAVFLAPADSPAEPKTEPVDTGTGTQSGPSTDTSDTSGK